MPLIPPNLDDRSFDQLLRESLGLIARECPAWTDLTPHDPGMVLVEAFAHLTETMIYRLNRVPEKAYVQFLNLIGVQINPPSAAGVDLTFSIARPAEQTIEIPEGTRVAAGRAGAGAEPAVFVTDRHARIERGQLSAVVPAHHCEWIQGELLGHGTGHPGLALSVRRPPIIASIGGDLDLIVAVEARADELELSGRARAREFNGKAYRVWSEVQSFSEQSDDEHVYLVDRVAGTILFAPAAELRAPDGGLSSSRALAAVPGAGREIRVWYRRGGGASGNIVAGALTTLKDPIPSVKVTNVARATGGRDAESLANALVRGPAELRSLRRAVTAKDYEMLALRTSGSIERAKAVTQAALFRHAPPGAVEVLLVPHVPETARGEPHEPLTLEMLREHQREADREQIRAALDQARPMGTTCAVNWTHYKRVSVRARVVVHRGEDREVIKRRSLARLCQTISPLSSPLSTEGWRFGQALRASTIYDTLLAEPGVSFVDGVRLVVDDVPGATEHLAADAFQASTWYAGSGAGLYRSFNDGDGWELSRVFEGEKVIAVRVHPSVPGLLALATRLGGSGEEGRVYISRDCGETWEPQTRALPSVNDLAWTMRDGAPLLFIATGVGLFELSIRPEATPLQVVVDKTKPSRGFWAVAAWVDARGASGVALAATESAGIYFSPFGGRNETFGHIGLANEDTRILEVQSIGPRTFLWTGVASIGTGAGKGCFRIEVFGDMPRADRWEAFGKGWEGGSNLALACWGWNVFAATHRMGVLWLDASRNDASWRRPEPTCGLPLREMDRLFHPVTAIAAGRSDAPLLLAGGGSGVFRTKDFVRYERSSAREFSDAVTLPKTWLFCSGAHEIDVVDEDEA